MQCFCSLIHIRDSKYKISLSAAVVLTIHLSFANPKNLTEVKYKITEVLYLIFFKDYFLGIVGLYYIGQLKM